MKIIFENEEEKEKLMKNGHTSDSAFPSDVGLKDNCFSSCDECWCKALYDAGTIESKKK